VTGVSSAWGVSARTAGVRLPVSPPLLIGAGLVGAACAGAAMAYSPRFGVGAVAALCYTTLALLNLPMAIVLWLPFVSLIAVDTLNVFPLGGMVILVAWFGLLASARSRVAELVVEHGRLLVGVGALVLWLLLSSGWADEPVIGGELSFRWLTAGAIVLVISTTLTESRYLRLGVAAIVAGAVLSVAVGLVGGAVDVENDRVVGGTGDANGFAAGLAPAIVLAAGIGAGTRRALVRLAVLAAVAFLVVGIATSRSRGGLLAAAVAALAVLILAKRHRAWALGLVLCVLGAGFAWFSVDSAAWARISDFNEDTGRTELWGVGWQMWQDHPLFGVGLNGFIDNAAGYVRALGPLEFAEFLTEEPKFVHNTYLQLLTEAGLVGLVLFLGVVVVCVRRAWQAAVLFERAGDAAMTALSRSVIAALISVLAAAFFLNAATDARLWVLLALGPAMWACARSEFTSRTARAGPGGATGARI
jgi:O-antigen ligase